jgi:hypothetical protein
MNSTLTFSEIALKIINVILMMMLIKIFRTKSNYNENVESDVREKNVESDVREKNEWYEYSPGILYKGEWLNGVPHGNGIAEFLEDPDTKTSHSFVIGEFVNGHIQGRAIQVYDRDENEDKISFYEGDFKDSNQDGNGTYHYGCGSCYVGEFRNGYYEGNGRFTSVVENNITHGIYKENKCVEIISVRDM